MPEMPKSNVIWCNGENVPWDQAKIHVLSHVVHYGSSVFEGIRCYDTKRPTQQPSARPTEQPSEQPTRRPSEQPTERPTEQPTKQMNNTGELHNKITERMAMQFYVSA